MLAQALIEVQRTQVADGQLGTLDNLRLVIVNIPFLKLHSSNSRKHFVEHLFNLLQFSESDNLTG
jgi:hypothetical protein